MYKKTITYNDYDGNERTEDFHFNLTEAEVVEMEMGVTGGMTQMLERIVKAQDTRQIVTVFKEILLKSYGEKSPDGRRFIKSKEISEAFAQTEAYSKLFMELSTDADKASDFFNHIIPQQKAPTGGQSAKPGLPATN